jgi:glycolate oxidase iron-sulfur subunit
VSEHPLGRAYPGTLDCVHCGLCLPVCPTYRETGRETSSPRGRVYLMRGVAEGRIPLGETVVEEAYLCLGCRACETACPSGVEYGALLEETREEITRAGLRGGAAPAVERAVLRGLVARPRRLETAATLLAFVQWLRLDRLVLPFLPRGLREAHALLPALPPGRERRRLPEHTPARGARRGRVAFLEGCIMPLLFGDVNRAAVDVLSAAGYDVWVPPQQGCCGALHSHAGDGGFARALARANVAAFDLEDLDAVIVDSAGCGAALREYDRWLPGEGGPLAFATRDVCEFLDEVGLQLELAPLARRVCYDDPCHLVHGQGVEAAPRRLLARIPGLELVDHDDPTGCCGAAGIYNITHPEMSRAVLDRKLDALAAAAPEVIATGNPGCLMQLRAGAAARGLAAEVLHPIQLLASSLPV